MDEKDRLSHATEMDSQEMDLLFQEVLRRQPQSWSRTILFLKRDLDRWIATEFIDKQYPRFGINCLPLMGVIAGNDGMISIELAKQAGITRQAMSQIMAEMKQWGYVETRPSPTDARRELISLTDKGKKVVVDFARCMDTLTTRYGSLIGEKQFNQAASTLARLPAEMPPKG